MCSAATIQPLSGKALASQFQLPRFPETWRPGIAPHPIKIALATLIPGLPPGPDDLLTRSAPKPSRRTSPPARSPRPSKLRCPTLLPRSRPRLQTGLTRRRQRAAGNGTTMQPSGGASSPDGRLVPRLKHHQECPLHFLGVFWVVVDERCGKSLLVAYCFSATIRRSFARANSAWFLNHAS